MGHKKEKKKGSPVFQFDLDVLGLFSVLTEGRIEDLDALFETPKYRNPRTQKDARYVHQLEETLEFYWRAQEEIDFAIEEQKTILGLDDDRMEL